MSKHTVRIPTDHHRALAREAHRRSDGGLIKISWADILREAVDRHVRLLRRRDAKKGHGS